MKSILAFAVLLSLSACAVCPEQMASDPTMGCDVGFTDYRGRFVCTQYSRHASLMTKQNKFGKPVDKK